MNDLMKVCRCCGKVPERNFNTDGWYVKVQKVEACGHEHMQQEIYCDACFFGALEHLWNRSRELRETA